MSGFPQSSTSATSLLLPNADTKNAHLQNSLAQKFSLSPSPLEWGSNIDPNAKDPDDHLHNPDPIRDRGYDKGGHIFTARGVANLGCLFILVTGMTMLFAGYPILSHFLTKKPSTNGGFNLGGINATGQVPTFPTNFQLIDKDTPQDVYSKISYETGEELVLVFSDEFNEDGRSFYPGDDPFWEAPDLHYWGTNDLEWYDATQPTTKDGALRLTIERVEPADNHNMSYRSGMIQSWNKFCFTGGLIETAVTLPGSNNVAGFWPAVWAMGNLGRAGYGASLDGMWPYTYDSCDVGTLPNQTYPGTSTPVAAATSGDPGVGGTLSYLPGQRLSACTCPGESHPGPVRANGSYVGRSSPEIDVFEALIGPNGGEVSLSAQWAPFNSAYKVQTEGNSQFFDQTQLNAYIGGYSQQTTSGLALTNPDCYELEKGCFSVYGFEYKPGYGADSYITWINDGKVSWKIYAPALAGDPLTEIGPRPIPFEPMYIIANLGFSTNFASAIDYDALKFPATMSVDYIRVYQPKNSVNVGCDPPGFPTSAYIATYKEAYTNFNLTTWQQAGQVWPKNRMETGSC